MASQVEHEVTVQEMIVLPDTRATVRSRKKDRCYSLRTASGPGGVEIKVRNAHETNGASLSLLPLRIRPGAEISFCSPPNTNAFLAGPVTSLRVSQVFREGTPQIVLPSIRSGTLRVSMIGKTLTLSDRDQLSIQNVDDGWLVSESGQ